MLSTSAKDVQAVHIGLAQLEYDGAPLAAAASTHADLLFELGLSSRDAFEHGTDDSREGLFA